MDSVLTMSSKQQDQLESGIALLSGIAAWEFQATEKIDHGVGLISKQRFGDAIAQTFGAGVASKMFPNTSIRGKQTLNPAGMFNQTTFTGVALLVADKLAEEFLGSSYKNQDGLQAVVRGTGRGVTVGGLLGGLVDDSPFAFGIPYSANPTAFGSTSQFSVPLINR